MIKVQEESSISLRQTLKLNSSYVQKVISQVGSVKQNVGHSGIHGERNISVDVPVLILKSVSVAWSAKLCHCVTSDVE